MRFRWALAIVWLASLACNTLLPPKPEIAWDPSPDALVVEVRTGGGLAPMNYYLNYIPDARVWGDGRIVWVEYNGQGGRRVLEGDLTSQQMTELLQEISDSGFFGWAGAYGPVSTVMDAATTSLTVNLLSIGKRVSEYAGQGAPAKFDDLLDLVTSGAGASGTDVVPATGYVTAIPLGPAGGQAQYHWPDASLGYDLGTATGGRYLDGEGLEFAWRVVNENSYEVIESGEMDYQITVQVPGLSDQQPPPP
jgi:hypothetical protein